MPEAQPRAKKSLGQNFLKDKNIARKIVEALQISPQDRVLEIGPGPGALTGFILAAAPAELVLVEKDDHWAGERLAAGQGFAGRFQVQAQDALTVEWRKFVEPWKFIGNLPYNVASPLMWDIFSQAPGLQRAVFMIQKEVGERLVAAPGGKDYGALSVWVQSHVKPRMEFIVPPQVFTPQPKVHSAVLSFTPLEGRDNVPAGLGGLLKMCFQQRRKQLGTIFKANNLRLEVLEQLGIKPELRPEALTVREFNALALRVAGEG